MPRKIFAFLISFICIQIYNFTTAWANDVTVFEARRPLSMENNREMPKDYFINAGKNDGVKVGMVFKVLRRQSLYDAYKQKAPEELVVPVGELKIIHDQGDISVARLEDIFSRDRLPTLEVDGVMVGDRVDMSSGRMAPAKTASLDTLILSPIVLGSPINAVEVQSSQGTMGSADVSSTAPTSVSATQPL